MLKTWFTTKKNRRIIYIGLAAFAVLEIALLLVVPHWFSANNQATSTKQLSTAQLKTASDKANDLMKNLYQWSNKTEYQQNKSYIVQNLVSNQKVIDKLMPDDQDDKGTSQIDSNKLTSAYGGAQVYPNTKKYGDLTVIVTTTAAENSQSTGDKTSKSTGQPVYKVHYDPKSGRFTSITYQGEQSSQASS